MERELRLVLTVNGGSFNVSIDEAETGDFVEFSGEFDKDTGKLGLWLPDEIGSWLSIMKEQEDEEND